MQHCDLRFARGVCAVMSNNRSRTRSDSRARIRSGRVMAAIVAGIKASEKASKPKSVASEAPVTKAFATETAAMKTAVIRLGTSSGDQRTEGNHNNGYGL